MDRNVLIQNHFEDLADALERIERATIDWWESVDVWWFTDHSVRHSREVAEKCDAMVTAREIPAEFALNEIELFILEAAAWMHDAGMQSSTIIDSAETSEAVRRAHPERSMDLIANTTVQHGIRDSGLVDAVSRVAHAHGTDYYRTVVDSMPEVRTIRGRRVRMKLLAALLLMADELDLSSDRALNPRTDRVLPAENQSHFLKHQTVSGVRLEADATGQVVIVIEMLRPQNMGSTLFANIQYWIKSKLLTQIALVEKELASGFAGHFRFSRDIKIHWDDSATRNPLVTAEVAAYIERECSKSILMNHRAALKASISEIKEGHNVQILGARTKDSGDDLDGREDLLRAAIASIQADGIQIASRDEPFANAPATAADILESWSTALEVEIPDELEDAPETTRRATLLGAVVQAVDGRPVVFALSSFDALSPKERAWMVQSVFPVLSALTDCRIVLTTSPKNVIDDDTVPWETVTLGPVPKDEKLAYIARFVETASAERFVNSLPTYHATREFAYDSATSVVER